MNCEKKFYLANGLVGMDFYNNYIKSEVSKKTQAKIKKLLEDDYIEYYRVSVDNPTDKNYEFSSLWFFDLQDGYVPVFMSNINTSSCLAMELCGMDREDEDEEENGMTLEELLMKFGNEKTEKTIKNLLS